MCQIPVGGAAGSRRRQSENGHGFGLVRPGQTGIMVDMGLVRRAVALCTASLTALAPALAAAAETAGECQVVDVAFQPQLRADLSPGMNPAPQIVVWVEDTAGNYIDTLFITRETGTYGLGNRPGRWDFNSGPQWPYGRRTGV